MPVGLEFSRTEMDNIYRALRKIDKETPHIFRGDTSSTRRFSQSFRSALNRTAKSLGATIPPKAPIPGLSRKVSPGPWAWQKPRPSIRASKGKRPRPNRPTSAVSIRFKTRAPNHGFYIVELAREARTSRGVGFINSLNSRLPIRGGLGRTVIPAFRNKGAEITQIATGVMNQWVRYINRNLKSRGRI